MAYGITKLIPALFTGLLIMVSLFVFRRGGPSEKAAISIIVVGSILSGIVAHHGMLWEGAEYGVLVVDTAVLGGFIAILARSRHFWPLWVTAFQIVAVGNHFARLVSVGTMPFAYAVAEQLWAYLMLAILVVVTSRARIGRQPG